MNTDPKANPVRISPQPFVFTPWYPILVISAFLLGVTVMVISLANIGSSGSKSIDRAEYRAALSEYNDALEIRNHQIDSRDALREVGSDMASKYTPRIEDANKRIKRAREALESFDN